jgi:hypothetical protein
VQRWSLLACLHFVSLFYELTLIGTPLSISSFIAQTVIYRVVSSFCVPNVFSMGSSPICSSFFTPQYPPWLYRNIVDKAICTVITTAWLDLWDQRNTDRHGKDASQKSIALCAQAISEITVLYSFKIKVLQRDHYLFTESLLSHIDKPTNHIRQWINTNQPVILKSVSKTQNICRYSMFAISNLISIIPPRLRRPIVIV